MRMALQSRRPSSLSHWQGQLPWPSVLINRPCCQRQCLHSALGGLDPSGAGSSGFLSVSVVTLPAQQCDYSQLSTFLNFYGQKISLSDVLSSQQAPSLMSSIPPGIHNFTLWSTLNQINKKVTKRFVHKSLVELLIKLNNFVFNLCSGVKY